MAEAECGCRFSLCPWPGEQVCFICHEGPERDILIQHMPSGKGAHACHLGCLSSWLAHCAATGRPVACPCCKSEAVVGDLLHWAGLDHLGSFAGADWSTAPRHLCALLHAVGDRAALVVSLARAERSERELRWLKWTLICGLWMLILQIVSLGMAGPPP